MKSKAIGMLLILLCGCQTTAGPKEVGGAYVGAAAGALLGSQIGKGHGRLASVALGTFFGSQVGATIGHSMDEEDKRMADQSTYKALEYQPDHQAVSWKNPNNNHAGKVVVTKTEEKPIRSQVCRDYYHIVMIDGSSERLHGRACRDIHDSKGIWVPQ